MSKPSAFGKYHLLERINVGGMAEVFKAKAFGVEGFERLFAVKRILPNIAEDEEFITMFIDEAKIAGQLQHANIAQIFDLGKVDDSYFIALEYVHGKDLRAIFDHYRKNGDVMPVAQACFVVMQMCEGLDYAHNKRDPQGRELNLVHRDVSPQNILIGYEGEIKLVDFGIAKAAGKASKTQAGILKGKFGYMSPEQVRGLPVDRRSDVFSVGICIYELLTGERLFVGESDFSTLEKVRNVEIVPPSSLNKKIPAELERIVLKALAKDVEDRYQNAIDLHDDLQAFLYSLGEFYSRKDLSAWMKRTFAGSLAEDSAKLEEYETLEPEEPTPIPPVVAVGTGAHARAVAKKAAADRRADGGGLVWDDEELETQIYDKAPDDEPSVQDAELISSDIVLQEADDRTAVASPQHADLVEAGLGAAGAQPAGRAVNLRMTMPYPQLRQPTPPTARGLGGPPPGLSAYRHTPVPGRPSGSRQAVDGTPPRTSFEGPRHSGPRPTLGSMVAQPPTTRDLGAFVQRKSRGLWVVVGLVVVAAIGLGGFRYMNRPGKLQIAVKPEDAEVSIDGQPHKGPVPIVLERAPGTYNVSVVKDGYVRRDQNVDIQAGELERVEIELEAAPDTGFELVSDPPGLQVWLDGKPFLGPDGQEARTNLKAYRVAPGTHVLEVKGGDRFQNWQHEFVQEPGRTLKIRAELQPPGAAPAAPQATTVAVAPPAPPPPPAPTASRPPPPRAEPRPTPPPRPATTAVSSRPRPEKPAGARAGSGKAGGGGGDVFETQTAPPKPAAVARPAAKAKVTEDVFEQETRLGSSASSGGGSSAGGGGECSVTIGSKPWAEVSIDGQSTGKSTPLVDHKVPCGKHRITLKNPEVPIERTETVSVRAGQKFKKVFQLVDTTE